MALWKRCLATEKVPLLFLFELSLPRPISGTAALVVISSHTRWDQRGITWRVVRGMSEEAVVHVSRCVTRLGFTSCDEGENVSPEAEQVNYTDGSKYTGAQYTPLWPGLDGVGWANRTLSSGVLFDLRVTTYHMCDDGLLILRVLGRNGICTYC